MILAGDIGGTKCNLGLFAGGGPRPLRLVFQRRYATREYGSYEDVVRDFLRKARSSGQASPVTAAAFASAGALVDGHFQCVNVPWPLDSANLARQLKLKTVLLLNDLQAWALSVAHLLPEHLLTLNPGVKSPATQALLAAGTGLGEAVLFWDGKHYQVVPSEGGQADFAPHTQREIELLLFMKRRSPSVCCEDLLSGRGFRAIHEFLDPAVVHASFKEPGQGPEKDPAAEITRLALAGACPVCV